jgi:uncharacterized protein YjbI with pentapeptide repeats
VETLKDTPFELGLFTWRVRPGQDTLVVAVKATFTIVPGAPCALADEQRPCMGEEPWDDDVPDPSLRVDTDLAVFKPVGEVFLHGACHPPGGRATVSAVALRFGDVHKQLAVFGDRVWTGSSFSSPAPFTAMPLRWERAYGGPGCASNPSGVGAPPVDGAPVRMLPNLEDPSRLIRAPHDAPTPWCTAPIARTWASRAALAGTYDARWKALRFPWFPDDFDWRYFLAAPPDQRAQGYWRGDETFALTNVHAEHAQLTGALPGIRPRLFTVLQTSVGATFQELLLQLDTVTLDVEAMEARCVWRGLMDVSSDRYEELTTLYVGHEPLDAPADAATWQSRMEALRQRLLDDENPAPEPIPEAPPPAPPALASLDLAFAAAPAAAVALDAATLPAAPLVDLRADVIEKLARGDSLAGEDLTGADLSGLDLTQQDLAGTRFTRANLSGARLTGSRLTEASLAGADLTGADLARAYLEKADLTGATLTSADLTEACLVSAVASEARMGGAVLYRVNATGVDLVGANLTGADLREALLDQSDLTGATLDGARCEGAVLRDAMASELIANGARFDGCDLDDLRASDGGSFLRATFRDAKASRSKWHGAALDDADFTGATLLRADFQGASLARARFDRCPLRNARLAGCTLTDATLLHADLFEASFEAADLTRTDLRGANLHGAELWRAKLDGVRTELAIVTRTRLEADA